MSPMPRCGAGNVTRKPHPSTFRTFNDFNKILWLRRTYCFRRIAGAQPDEICAGIIHGVCVSRAIGFVCSPEHTHVSRAPPRIHARTFAQRTATMRRRRRRSRFCPPVRQCTPRCNEDKVSPFMHCAWHTLHTRAHVQNPMHM